jgi:hypothetical protein
MSHYEDDLVAFNQANAHLDEMIENEIERQESATMERSLLQEAMLLGQYGERPPGAPDDPQAETWSNWFRRVEALLRYGRLD